MSANNGEWGGNDGDFNDYVILFSGLVCSGSGEACDTGGARHLRRGPHRLRRRER